MADKKLAEIAKQISKLNGKELKYFLSSLSSEIIKKAQNSNTTLSSSLYKAALSVENASDALMIKKENNDY